MKTFEAFRGIELNCSWKRSKRRHGIRSRKRKATQELSSQGEVWEKGYLKVGRGGDGGEVGRWAELIS